MRLVSFNIAGLPRPRYAHARARAFCEAIDTMDVTIINLQEVHGYVLLWLLRRKLKRFPYVSFRFGLFGPRAGLVTFSRVPIRVIGFQPLLRVTKALPKHLRPPGSLLEAFRKGVLITQIEGRPITDMNVHLNPNKDGDWSRESRFYNLHKAQLGALTRLIHRPQFDHHTVIMSGDFNLAKDCDLVPNFLKSGSWHDVFSDDYTPTFNAEYLPARRKPHCIDYMLIREEGSNVSIKGTSILFSEKLLLANGTRAYLSDHVGLMGNFEFSPKAK